jgi:hypothetical protein
LVKGASVQSKFKFPVGLGLTEHEHQYMAKFVPYGFIGKKVGSNFVIIFKKIIKHKIDEPENKTLACSGIDLHVWLWQ